MASISVSEVVFINFFLYYNNIIVISKQLLQNYINDETIKEIKKAIANPQKPTGFDYDLTINALIAFEDYNYSIHQAPFLLACIYKSDNGDINKKANEIISLQKRTVDEKQKEILDSIRYAQRIQKAHLPNEKQFTRTMERLKKSA